MAAKPFLAWATVVCSLGASESHNLCPADLTCCCSQARWLPTPGEEMGRALEKGIAAQLKQDQEKTHSRVVGET